MTTAPLLPFRLPAPTAERLDVLVIAGEHSGDEHAARLVRCSPQWRQQRVPKAAAFLDFVL
jgi:lipid A disaccharide synthetase